MLCVLLLPLMAAAPQGAVYEVKRGSAEFYSEAPKELISARSEELKGVFQIARRTFAFKIPIRSFQGFNTPMQRDHFSENYMETWKYPDAMFAGKVIEETDFTKNGVYTVRAKGKLTIHGISRERLIRSTVTVKDGMIRILAEFPVKLDEHDIKIPKVVYEKLAPEVKVIVRADMIPKQ